MNVSYEWLRAFVPFDQSPSELRELLTMHVATVDELIDLRTDLAPFVIARVVEEAPHPDSDHLHVTKVDAGTGVLLDVVCGAPNVTAGKLYPFAPTGTVMPSGLTIQKRKIRGAISDGMLCSARELGLGEEQDGILELTIDVPPGTPLLRALPIGDVRLVVDVGANRPDLLSHLGMAREIAALTKRAFAIPQIESATVTVPPANVASTAARAGGIDVSIGEAGLVRRFMGAVIRGVKIGPSPQWLVRRLEAVGSRSINNVVDASNYVLHELGQPTHAFDLAKLGGGQINVRRARDGEKITTLDGTDRTLNAEMIVIADAERPQAVAGVMGGRDSEVTENTTDVFLEVANFNPQRVRTARRTLGLSSDASYRFERGVDVEIAPRALERLAQIIIAVAGGTMDGPPVDLAFEPLVERNVTLRTDRVARVLGDPVPADEIGALLTSIGFDVETLAAPNELRVAVPAWRQDVAAEIDLIEEVARLRGYDSFSLELRPFRPGRLSDDSQWVTTKRVRDALVGAGMLEVRPMPFVSGGEGFVRVTNPLAENEAFLRRDVLDTLSRRAEYNLARMQGNLRIFEIGSVFSPVAGALPREELRVGIVMTGRRMPAHFTDPKSDEFNVWAVFNEWDAKAEGERVAALAYPKGEIVLEPAEESSEALWSIMVNGVSRGTVRRLALDAKEWAAPAFGVELTLDVIESSDVAPKGESAYRQFKVATAPTIRYQPLPTSPASVIDLALLVPESVQATAVEAVMQRVAGKLLERVELFDRYVGAGLEPGYRSLAWRLTFRHAERTLRDREIDARRSDILRTLNDELNVRQRAT